MKVRLKYVWEDTDRHGNVRAYVVMPGRPKIRIREMPNTPEFLAAYEDAVNGTETEKVKTSGRGTFGYIVKRFYASATFKRKDPQTQDWQRRALDGICESSADKPVALMQTKHVIKLRDEGSTDNMGNQRVQALRVLFKWACENREAPHNPAMGVAKIEVTSKGHHTWTSDEIAQYEAKHLVGTKARLALDLLQYTTCRREDVCRLGPQHLRGGRLVYTQSKNEHRSPVDMNIPVHPGLQESIGATTIGVRTFLITERGKPFEPDYFNAWFRKMCAIAGLATRCTPHGIRKFTSSHLAERGASAHEIQALTGHKTLSEVERYTAAARRSKMADTAMEKLK